MTIRGYRGPASRGRVDILCWAGIMLSGIFYWAILPFRASLVGTHPVFLVLLNGSTEAIVAAAAFARVGHGSLIVVLLAALFGLMKFDPLFWWAGRLWGERVIALLAGRRNRGAKYMGRVQRWGRKFTWPAMIDRPVPAHPQRDHLRRRGLGRDAAAHVHHPGRHRHAAVGGHAGRPRLRARPPRGGGGPGHLALRAVDLDRADRGDRVLPGALPAAHDAHRQRGPRRAQAGAGARPARTFRDRGRPAPP